MSNDKETLQTNLNGSSSVSKGVSDKTNVFRAAIYAHTAQTDQSHSYAQQVKCCSEYITEKGWKLVDVFFDEGVSGKAIEKPELRLMLTKAAQYSFDKVLVSSLDRISRFPKEILSVSKILKDFHVAIQSVNEQEMTTIGLNEFSSKFS